MTIQNMAGVADHQVDLEADFANEDETGYIWTWLDEARKPDQIVPGAVLTLRDGEDLAMGQVIDLVAKANGTIVHIELLPGAIEESRRPSSDSRLGTPERVMAKIFAE